jgi:Pathogenicity locus
MKPSKANKASEVTRFTDIPNIGPSMAKDFALLGILAPAQLAKQDAFALYTQLCKLTKTRQDPCVLDTFIAAVDFMQGAAATPWWHYTAERKRVYPNL